MALPRSVLYGSAVYHVSLMGRAPAALSLVPAEPWRGNAAAGARLAADSFRFAGESACGATPPWTAALGDRFLAALHGFSWLDDIAALGERAAWDKVRLWLGDWLAQCDGWEKLVWRADVVGRRLLAWTTHWQELAGRGEDAPLAAALLASMARQARHLGRVAGREAPGTKRLAAIAGLITAAAALGHSGKLERGLRLIAREAEAQILPDGGHVERSPRAQLDALRSLIAARAALAAAGVELPAALQAAIDRAAPMLRFFRHGDGALALFNGADEEAVEAVEEVLARAEAKGRAPLSAPHAGFQRLQAGRSLVLADTGAPPPAGLDEDAHAGTLSFEMSHGRERLIVNCGGYRGSSAEWRAVARATAAHSTLIVADTNSAEIRGGDGFGRRPRRVLCERAQQEGAHWLKASHDGYEPVFGLVHQRQLFLAADGEDLRGEDQLAGPAGQGFAIRFHLHPTVQASLAQDGTTVLLRLPGGIGWRLRAQGAVMSLAESIYLGAGELRKSQQVVLDGHVGSAGASVKWALRREGKKE
ncbi:MAG TPA: heparinase II/III family protein [Stellaceae bacterium]|nr:heparinase II/III family protein [Stellaceae bacterium]